MTYLFLGDIAFYIKIASGILSILLLITILILLINYLSFDSDKTMNIWDFYNPKEKICYDCLREKGIIT